MKAVSFIKLEAAGNDFIIVDAPISGLIKFAKRICNRKTSIGADGVLVLEKSKRRGDPSGRPYFKMRIINADGSEAEMCGNGVRCLGHYIVYEKKFKKKEFIIETLAGIIKIEVKGDIVSARLSEPKDYFENIPLDLNGRRIDVNYIDTGVPHAIVFVDRLKHIDVENIGRSIRHHKRFLPRGANANFVEQIDSKTIEVRTYERGVENETLACGTGSVASAIVTFLKANPSLKSEKGVTVKVIPKSHEPLFVSFDIKNRKPTNVWLKGNIKVIKKGAYNV